MKTTRPETKYRAPALEKGLDILELLSSIDTPIAMPQIAAELNRSKSEIFRMTAVLENRGYIERVKGTENFVVTNRLFAIGIQNPAKRNLIEAAGAPMRELAESINQSCHLAVASGNQIVVIYSTEAIGYISFSVKIGHRLPLLESASGRTLLAFQASDTQEDWLKFESDKAKRAAYRRRVTVIQNRGYEQAASEVVSGILDISAPILGEPGQVPIASLTMPLVKHLKLKEEQRAAVRAVCETAGEISRQLGAGSVQQRGYSSPK